MKKLTSVLLAVLLAAFMLAGCINTENPQSEETGEPQPSQSQPEESSSASQPDSATDEREPASINIGALKGPTAMGMVKLMDQAEANELDGDEYSFTIASTADELVPLLVQGQLDIAAVPANLSSVLYNNTQGQIQVLAINTLGVLYIVENGDTVQSLEDLAGKTLYASGKGATPEYALNYILEQAGLAEQVNIEWKSEHAECVAAISNDPSGIAMLPQPFVTTAQMQNENLRIALDLDSEWTKLQDGENPSALVTGVVIARREFVEENLEAVNEFMNRYSDSVAFVNGNLEEAAALVGKFDIVPEAVALKALPYCAITFIESQEMETMLSGYLDVLYSQNPEAVGGTLPGEDFYFDRVLTGGPVVTHR